MDEQVSTIASLGEPMRLALYRYVAGEPEPVSREQAAAAIGVALHVSKFHLDRLEADGLLSSEYRRPEGRSGPGAGRPSKLYRRAARDIAVSLPERRYDLAARVLAEAVTAASADDVPVADALREAAIHAGRRLGEQARTSRRGRSPSARIVEVLDEQGFEPHRSRNRITLANCPFHTLAADHPQLVCGMNLDLLTGLLGELEPHELRAELDPGPGRCCVTLRRAT